MKRSLIALVLFLIFLNIGIAKCGWVYEDVHESIHLGHGSTYEGNPFIVNYDFSNFDEVQKCTIEIILAASADPYNRKYEIYVNDQKVAEGIATGSSEKCPSRTKIVKDITDIVQASPKGTIKIIVHTPYATYAWLASVYMTYDGVYKHYVPDGNDQYSTPDQDQNQSQSQSNESNQSQSTNTFPQQQTETVEITRVEAVAVGIGALAIIVILLKLIVL